MELKEFALALLHTDPKMCLRERIPEKGDLSETINNLVF